MSVDWNLILERTPDAKLQLSEAYTRLFNGAGSKLDAEVVLTDIMAFSGYFASMPTNGDFVYSAGARSVGGRIFTMANLADWERTALHNAARQSLINDQNFGEI